MGKGRINYRRIKESELSVSLFADFDRYQEVNRCWRKEDGEWVLKDIVFNEQWSDSDYRYLTECLIHTIQTGGVVFGAFVEERLKGFASVEHEFFGQEKQYLELTSIHTSMIAETEELDDSFLQGAWKLQERWAQRNYTFLHIPVRRHRHFTKKWDVWRQSSIIRRAWRKNRVIASWNLYYNCNCE